MCIRAPVLVRGSFLWYCRGSSGYVVRFLNGNTELGEQPQKRVFWILEGLWLRHAPAALGRCGRHSIGGAGMRMSVCTREPGLVQQPAGSVREVSPRSTSAGWMLSSLPSVHLSSAELCINPRVPSSVLSTLIKYRTPRSVRLSDRNNFSV